MTAPSEAAGTTPPRAPRRRRTRVVGLLVGLVAAVTLGVGVWHLGSAPRRPDGVTLHPVVGPEYYQRFRGAPDYRMRFPIGVWAEVIGDRDDVAANRRAGINTFVGLEGTPNLAAVAAEHMYAIVAPRTPGATGHDVQGWLLSDEVDMWAGPGEDRWNGQEPGRGPVCQPADGNCGFTVQQHYVDQTPSDGRLRFANYGKGVLFWATDEQGARFVNDYQNIVATDAYWFTDRQLCSDAEGGRLVVDGPPRDLTPAECHRAENYGRAVERVRGLLRPGHSLPVWTFIELGHPSSDPAAPSITPRQIRAAVWSALIGGARGIVYFNHSFGGACPTHHILREPCYAQVREAVTVLNEQITKLTPALNGPDVHGVVQVDPGIRTLVKTAGDDLYVVSAGRPESGTTGTHRLACGGSGDVEVIGEDRTLAPVEDRFADEFPDEDTVRLYRLAGAAADCGLT